MLNDKHVIETLGKAEVVIENGEITYIGDPIVDYCPIFKKLHDADVLSKEYIKWNIEKRIREFGMCTPNRILQMDDVLSFGISEILKTNTEMGLLDCVVGVLEGCGTILITDPDTIQGVGGRVSALVSTTPIPEMIDKIGPENVLNPQTCELNQLEGLKMAIDKGYKNIAVTILPCDMIQEIRELEIPDDVNVYIFVAHTTDASLRDAEIAFEYADVITACASKTVRDLAEKNEVYYSGSKVPIFAVTEKGREFLDNRLEKIGKPLTSKDYPLNEVNIPNPIV